MSKRELPAATLTIRGASKMTAAQRKRIYGWLYNRATDFSDNYAEYGPVFTARVWQPTNRKTGNG